MALLQQIQENGFAIIPQALERARVEQLKEVLGQTGVVGQRGVLGIPAAAEVAASSSILEMIRPLLTGKPRAVRAIYFDKSKSSNWFVTWHQDLTLAVRSRIEMPGFGPWSVKKGIPHVQPPVELLETMITLRLHLDDCDMNNGALRVLPGTHVLGRLTSEAIQEQRKTRSEFVCNVPAGGALLMRPLLLHASGRSRSEVRRRVLHIEYAGFALPVPLDWFEDESCVL